jgi:hypothetical protein
MPQLTVMTGLKELNEKVGKKDIFKHSIDNENLHEVSNHNGARVVNFYNVKDLIFKSSHNSPILHF